MGGEGGKKLHIKQALATSLTAVVIISSAPVSALAAPLSESNVSTGTGATTSPVVVGAASTSDAKSDAGSGTVGASDPTSAQSSETAQAAGSDSDSARSASQMSAGSTDSSDSKSESATSSAEGTNSTGTTDPKSTESQSNAESTESSSSSFSTEVTPSPEVSPSPTVSPTPTPLENYPTVYDGIDYAPVYNFNYYIQAYPDLAAAFSSNPEGALKHFATFGMKEQRQAIADFNEKSYRYAYKDLRKAFGSNYAKYYLHYIQYGKKEGRNGGSQGFTEIQDPVTSYEGTDYAAVFDYKFYWEHNADVQAAFARDDDYGLLKDFVTNGMNKGRQASASFDPASYRYAYADLRQAFGTDYARYYSHFLTYGEKEGRKANQGFTEPQNPATALNGTDYSLVFDYKFYWEHNPSVKSAFASDDDYGLLRHFVSTGMKNGLQGNEAFNVAAYRANYPDLQKAFGNDLTRYYLHYIQYGHTEGRSCENSFTPVANGIDYSPVFDISYYEVHNPDVVNAYGAGNLNGIFQHYLTCGIREGRQSSANFDVRVYRRRYNDLWFAFGTDFSKYVTHYLTYGIKEGRSGAEGSDVTSTQYTEWKTLGILARNGDSSAKQAVIHKIATMCDSAVSKYHMLRSVLIAQVILESGWLRDTSSSMPNNILGMNKSLPNSRWTSPWLGKYASVRVSQEVNGRIVYDYEDMRCYEDMEACIEDYAAFVTKVKGVGGMTDSNAVIERLKSYATDSSYASKLRSLISKYNLNQYN